MKDKRGFYYYPFSQNRKIRMYVRKAGSEICFRLWSPDDSKLWEEHGWVPYEAIKQAAGITGAAASIRIRHMTLKLPERSLRSMAESSEPNMTLPSITELFITTKIF